MSKVPNVNVSIRIPKGLDRELAALYGVPFSALMRRQAIILRNMKAAESSPQTKESPHAN